MVTKDEEVEVGVKMLMRVRKAVLDIDKRGQTLTMTH